MFQKFMAVKMYGTKEPPYVGLHIKIVSHRLRIITPFTFEIYEL